MPLLKNITTEGTENTEKNKKKNSADSALSAVKSLVDRLVTYRILRFDAHDRTYTTHPLIRNHYLALLTKGDAAQEKSAHEQIKDYYLSIAGDTPEYPTLDDLKPLIEVVHHACEAGAYDEAWCVYWERISQRDRFVIVLQLGAYETTLALMFEFFPNGDTTQEPQVSNPSARVFILNAIGFRLMSLGRLSEVLAFYERALNSSLANGNLDNASSGYQNLAELNVYCGALSASVEAARDGLILDRKKKNKGNERISLSRQAWAEHLCGNLSTATLIFAQAEKLEKEVDSNAKYLYSQRGILHSDHLRCIGQADYSRRITETNLSSCEERQVDQQISQCHRVLGDLDSDSGDHTSARVHYDTALKIGRSISFRPALIEALLARGRWSVKYMQDATSAFNDLNEALGYAVDGGYRIYEADIRVALAWGWIVDSGQWVVNREKAKMEAGRALRMSEEMGYYWGKVDAEEVLKVVSGQG